MKQPTHNKLSKNLISFRDTSWPINHCPLSLSSSGYNLPKLLLLVDLLVIWEYVLKVIQLSAMSWPYILCNIYYICMKFLLDYINSEKLFN